MIKVKRLVEILQTLPEDALLYPYEGEIIGIVVLSGDKRKELGYIPATEKDQDAVSFMVARDLTVKHLKG